MTGARPGQRERSQHKPSARRVYHKKRCPSSQVIIFHRLSHLRKKYRQQQQQRLSRSYIIQHFELAAKQSSASSFLRTTCCSSVRREGRIASSVAGMASSSRAQGRGSAVAAAAALVTLLVLVHGAVAADYPVAGTGTWTFGQYQAWADGINFVEGDTITFTYSPTAHDVVTLNSQADFDSCNVASPKQLYNSGNDKIALVAGTNFFTCQFPSHCPAMKFSAVAAQAASPPTTPAPTTPAPATPPTSPAPTTPAPTTPPTTPAPTTPPTTPAPTTPPTTPTPVSPATPPRTPPPPTTRTPPRAAPAPAPSAAGSVKATLATVFGAAALALVI